MFMNQFLPEYEKLATALLRLALCVPGPGPVPGPVHSSYFIENEKIIYTELFCELSHINIILSLISCIRVGGVKVSIVAFQAIDPGSIPG